MPRPPRPWFRFYVEAVHDPKLRGLDPKYRWLWVAVLAAARQSVEPGALLVSPEEPMDARALADWAGMTPRDVVHGMDTFLRRSMVHVNGGGAWHVTAWDARQFESDDVTARTRAWRGRQRDDAATDPARWGRNHEETFPGTFVGTHEGTPTETETETETESARERASAPARRGSRIPIPWILSDSMLSWAAEHVPGVNVETETTKFVDHWRAATGAKASKLDWEATWRNWLRRAAEGWK